MTGCCPPSLLWSRVSLLVVCCSRHFTRKGQLDGIDSIRFFAPLSHHPPLGDAFSTGFSDDLTILRVWQLLGRPKHFELAYGWTQSPPPRPSLPSSAVSLLSKAPVPACEPLFSTPDLQLDTPVLLPRPPVSLSHMSQASVCLPPTTTCMSFMSTGDLPADVSLLPAGLLLPELSFGLQSPMMAAKQPKRIQPQLISAVATMGQ
jgi:hypothetical protein